MIEIEVELQMSAGGPLNLAFSNLECEGRFEVGAGGLFGMGCQIDFLETVGFGVKLGSVQFQLEVLRNERKV